MEKQLRDLMLLKAGFIFPNVLAVVEGHPDLGNFEERGGIYYSVLNIKTGQMEFSVPIGWQMDQSKESRYCMLSQEKAYRLYQNLGRSHITSLESVDEAHGMFSGAVKGKEYIHSISGLTSGFLDSIVAATNAILIEDLDSDAAFKLCGVLRISKDIMAEIIMIIDLVDLVGPK